MQKIEISRKTQALLAFSMIDGVGPSLLKRIAAIPGFQNLDLGEIAQQPSFPTLLEHKPIFWDQLLDRAHEQVEKGSSLGIRIISFLDSDYPTLLSQTVDDPCLLFVRGTLLHQTRKSAAIIGTREPTRHGAEITRRISQFFLENQWSVVSGLASGCDSIAHQTAIESKGHTIAVLAHGLHTIYPPKQRQLAEDIIHSGGALVSQYPVGQEASRHQFVIRDKTQAGLCNGVVMIQSALTGGSLHAARAALKYHRWLAIPYPTATDISNKEANVQANLRVIDGPRSQAANLLQCSQGALQQIITLRNKGDYAKMLSAGSGNRNVDSPQTPLF